MGPVAEGEGPGVFWCRILTGWITSLKEKLKTNEKMH